MKHNLYLFPTVPRMSSQTDVVTSQKNICLAIDLILITVYIWTWRRIKNPENDDVDAKRTTQKAAVGSGLTKMNLKTPTKKYSE